MNGLLLLNLESVALALVKVDVLRNNLNSGILSLWLRLLVHILWVRQIGTNLLDISIVLQLSMLLSILEHHDFLERLVLTALVDMAHIHMA